MGIRVREDSRNVKSVKSKGGQHIVIHTYRRIYLIRGSQERTRT